MNYLRAPFLNLDVGVYLAEPLMVIVAGYTLVSVVLIGRGVFCGWLCPFGALQELLGQLSRALRVPQWNPPFPVATPFSPVSSPAPPTPLRPGMTHSHP